MFPTFFTAALFVATLQGVAANFAINSPKLIQCQSARISWEPTKGPYSVVITKARDPCGEPLVDLGDFTTTITQWKVTLAPGTEVQLSVVDANDQVAWSGKLTVVVGSDWCLHSTTTSSSSAYVSSSSSPTPSPTASPIGAATPGSNPVQSSGITARQACLPAIALAGILAVLFTIL